MKISLLNKNASYWLLGALLKIMVLFSLSIMMVNNAWAMKCVQSPGEAQRFTENIGSVAVPPGVDGETIWRSENRTMSVQCWKDNGGAAEDVYIYFNPAKATLGRGIQIGMVINNVQINNVMTSGAIKVPGGVTLADCTGQTEAWCKANRSAYFTLSYYVFIVKNGLISGSNYPGANTLDVFQIDGAGGMSSSSNFRYALTNLQGIRYIGCQVNLTTTPNRLALGTLDASDAVPGKIIAERDFMVNITKDCDTPIVLTASYSSPSEILDDTTLKLRDLGIRFKNMKSGKYVQYRNVEPLVDMTNTNVAEIPYRFELSWLSDDPVLDLFSTSLSITVYYN